MLRESYESFDSLVKSAMNIISPHANEDHYDNRDHNRRPIEKDVEKRDLDIELLTLMSEGLITENEVEEIRLRRKMVVRGGKKVRKKVCGPGFRLVDGKCKRQSAREKLARKLAAKKAAKKRKGRKSAISRSRQRSLRKRRALGL